MNTRFNNQVALITGAADGIGKAIAKRLASEGATVVLLDINSILLENTAGEFRQAGYTITTQLADIANENEVSAAVNKVLQDHGKLDIMVNSAGIVGPTSTPIADYPAEAFDKIYNINLRGSFLMTKYAVQAMEKNGYGRILLMASIGGKDGNPNMCGYSSMKSGVIGLVKGVGKEYATRNITVNGLAPAVIKTAMNENTSPDQLAYMTAKIPMNRLGTVEEVASIAAWIVSPEASFNTGFIFDISGGRATY